MFHFNKVDFRKLKLKEFINTQKSESKHLSKSLVVLDSSDAF